MQGSLTLRNTQAPRATAAETFRRSVSSVQYIDASDTARIRETFEKKVPFVIENAEQNPHGIDVGFVA